MFKSLIWHGLMVVSAWSALLAVGPDASAQTNIDVSASVGGDVDINVFYDELSPHGDWFQLEGYGWVWTPDDVPVDWRPYTVGRWVYSDCGWTWASDFSWGWAPFHYGRWFFEPRHGWVWVPDTEWAPAWVSWRKGTDYLGWAALPPEAKYHDLRVDFGGMSVESVVAEHAWSFVEPRYIVEPDIRRFVVVPARNVTLVRYTEPVTRHVSIDGRIGDFSIDIDFVERWVSRPVTRVRIRDVEPTVVVRRSYIQDNDFHCYRPRVRKAHVDARPRIIESPKRVVPYVHVGDWHGVELRELDSRREREREVLRVDQDRELRVVNKSVDVDSIRRRQEVERQSLDNQYKLRKTVVEQRQERQRGAARGDDDSARDDNRGRNDNQGRGRSDDRTRKIKKSKAGDKDD